jgi:predicted PurR-regulated permease PerM
MEYSDLRKVNSIFIFGFAVLATLYFGSGFFIPFTFAAFMAALMRPVAAKLEEFGLNKGFSALLSCLTVFVVLGGLAYLFFNQLRLFTEDLPQIEEQLREFQAEVQQQLASTTGLSPEEQREVFQERLRGMRETLEQQVTTFLGNMLYTILMFMLVLVYIFLFLLNREKYMDFFLQYVPAEKEGKAREIIQKSSRVAHQYLWGRIQVMTILGVMYIITFTIFDIPYTILLTIFGALITIIPYIGPFISGIIPVVFAVVFGMELSEVLLFASVILVIQLIESYVLEPVILGSEVRLSPLAVIIAILVGGAVWGIAGMILFVPLFAICKILFDYTPHLKPLGFLIGNKHQRSEGAGSKRKKSTEGFSP